jgi:hypothetical protein
MDRDQSAFGESELSSIARTFADSAISLLRRSVASSGCTNEGMFLMLVMSQGFIQAKCIAEGLGLPHERSARVLWRLFFGPKSEYGCFDILK